MAKKDKTPPNRRLEDMERYTFGDHVIYDKSPYEHIIGRVTTVLEQDGVPYAYSVCYHAGCTASVTPAFLMRRATSNEIARASKDAECPNVTPGECDECRLLAFTHLQ